MKIVEFEKLIVESDSEDWIEIPCWGSGSGPSFFNSFNVWTHGNGGFAGLETDSHHEVMSFKADLRIGVACGISHNSDFIEEWANNFPNRKATSGFVDFFFNGMLVFRDIYVAVDGGRCRLPLPKQEINDKTLVVERLTVSKRKSKFFSLLNGGDGPGYSNYLERSGIQLIDTPWMC